MSSLAHLTLKQYIDGISTKTFSRDEVVTALEETHEQTKECNIYLTRTDSNVQVNQDTPLAGAPLAIKDNVCTQGTRTTAASTVLDTFVPAYDATIIKKIRHAGGSCIGKTNMDAWAHGSSTETSQYGRTLNPRNSEYLPGGSSGGSAAAIAADTCIAAIGTETAGSIRQPAAWCGTVGLKPTYGRVSRNGIIAMASSTDSPGPITKTVEDAAVLLNHLAGHDPLDGTTSSAPVPDYTATLGKSIAGLKIGILYNDLEGMEDTAAKIATAAQVLSDLGAHVENVKALDPHYAISVYTIIQRGEVSSNLARFDGIRYGADRSQFGDEARRRIMLGTFTLSKGYADAYYTTAQKVRTLYREDFSRLFERYDCLISATSPSFAKKLGATEGAAMFGELEDMLVEPSSITGLPGISVPCYRDEHTNLFLGLNIMAPFFREDVIIQVADAYERATPWNTWRTHA